MKTTRTYLQGCNWCNATGIKFPMEFNGISLSSFCPVCNGTKTIIVTEVTESDASQRLELTDEDVITYFNNHSTHYMKDNFSFKVPVMARSDVIEMFKWARDRQKPSEEGKEN